MTTIAGPTPLEIERLSKRDGKRHELHHGQLVNTYNDVDERIDEYLNAGVPLIWVVNPIRRHVFVHRRDGLVSKYQQPDTIKYEPLLPDLVVNVAEFFPEFRRAHDRVAATRIESIP